MLKAPILPSTATTNAAQDARTTRVDGNYDYSLFLEWVPGVTGNVLTVKIYTRVKLSTGSDGQWTQEMTWANTTGTITRTLSQLQHTAASTTVVPLRYDFTGQAEEMYFTFVESDAGGVGKGTLVGTLLARSRS
jgi:hypothetical protein